MDTIMEDKIAESTRHGQVQVHFITSSEDPTIELEEGKRQLLVPTNVRRYGLSQILNSESMLNTDAPIPFDFLINGTFLRTTLEEYLTANGLSSETTVDLQYVRSLIPPLYEASFEHDDWVSCVDVLSTTSKAGSWDGRDVILGQERILSGSYDGLLRVWNKSGQTIVTSASSSAGGHSSSIKSAKFISPTQIASAGLDRTIRIWKYAETEDHFSATLKPTLELYGHKGGIESIDVWGPSNQVLSGSTEGTIGLWTTLKNSAPEANPSLVSSGPTAKRRKLTTSTSTAQRGPLSLISSHSGPVNAVIFNPLDHTVAYSASQDHTIRTFDLTTSSLVDTRTTSHPLLSLTALPGISHQLLAAGTSARHITLLDPRISSQSTQVMTLRGHTNKIVSLAQDPESRFGLVSGSHDGTCRVWDLRSSRQGTKDEGGGQVGEAVYVVERESQKDGKRPVGGDGIKVFGVAWDENVGIVSGGEDKMLQINRGRGVTKPASS
ncbi:microtubule-associated protein-like protein ytm1 [Rhexocercosporidium sp. MPI-PUGE-AT-0058]|nr:microtubule-associated protein-like protein ytm1 [Rhexocercosporidium sp. MPI-PUGE-AT-0058]